MSRYLVMWSANEAAWPADPRQALAVLEGARDAVARMQESGALRDIGWVSAQQGFALFETGSKDQLLGLIHGFWPYYRQQVHEIAPWAHGVEAILATARKLAAS